MKSFVVAVCFCALVLYVGGENILTPEERSTLDVVHKTCVVGTDVQENHVMNALNQIYIKDNGLTNYFQCVFRLYGFVDKTNEVKTLAMKTRIPSEVKNKESVEKAIDECAWRVGGSSSEIAYEFFKCFRDSAESADHYWRF